MITLDMLPQQIVGLRIDDVSRWVELSWVRPDQGSAGWVFREIDVARVRLIMDLRDQFSFDEEAMPTILSLLDQLYEARRQMHAIRQALSAVPPEAMDAVLRALPE